MIYRMHICNDVTRRARAGCLQNINYYDNLCGMIIVYTYQY